MLQRTWTKLTWQYASPGDTTQGYTLTRRAGGSSLPSAQGIFPEAACARRARMRAGLFGGCSGLLHLVWVRWAYVGRVHHGRAGHPYAHISPHVQEKDNGLTKYLTN